jgi:hypothetical protein
MDAGSYRQVVGLTPWLWGNSQGHPQYLKNTTITGLPSIAGNFSFTLLEALSPICGGSRTTTGGAGGACHEEKALGGHCTLAKGFAKPSDGVPSAFLLESDFGNEGIFTSPRPARCSATFVASLLNIVSDSVGRWVYQAAEDRG